MFRACLVGGFLRPPLVGAKKRYLLQKIMKMEVVRVKLQFQQQGRLVHEQAVGGKPGLHLLLVTD
jgi:hypothetical protein